MSRTFEIGIIGAGPAGSTAAAYLASYGFEVCLLEKKLFPREVLCGEFLSAEVISSLKEQDLYDEFISLQPNRIKSFRFFNSTGKSVNSKFNFEAFGLSRSLLDNLLLCNAKRKGAVIYQPAEVKEINQSGNYYQLICETGGREKKIVNVKNLIASYGKQNVLDTSLKRGFTTFKSKLNGIKFHISINDLKNFMRDEIKIYTADRIYCGVNLINNDIVTFCFLEDRNYELPPPRKQLVELQEKNQAFKDLFKNNGKNIFDAIPVFGTGNIYFGKKNLIEDGIFMIGDAAGVIAPLSGDGIGIAMESGKMIADLFNKKRKENLTNSELKINFEKEWNNLFFKRMKMAKVIQNIILNKFGRETGFFLIKNFPGLMPYLIKSTRNIFGKKF